MHMLLSHFISAVLIKKLVFKQTVTDDTTLTVGVHDYYNSHDRQIDRFPDTLKLYNKALQ